jgi:SAM-dependent methyltransferase
VEGYTASSYGDGLADVYDEWYAEVSDVATTVRALAELAGDGTVLELGVGTGRIALPLALATGRTVHGVDASTAMLARLRDKDDGHLVTIHHGDMVDVLRHTSTLPPLHLVFIAYNTLFNLVEPGAQAALFDAVAERLVVGGRFVVEAFVPGGTGRDGDHVGVRSIGVDHVVLSISVHDAQRQTAHGHFVELSEAGGVRLRPWSIRYATLAQLDAMAVAAGFVLERRAAGFEALLASDDAPIGERHVSVYRRTI